MSLPSDRVVLIEAATRTRQAALLEGLHAWIDLGLLDDGQARIRIFAEDAAALPSTLTVDITLTANDPFLAGLDTWLQMGLLSQAHLSVEAQVRVNAPALLAGLDVWLQLDLLSHEKVLQLCRSHLTSLAPPIIPQTARMPTPKASVSPVSRPRPVAQPPKPAPKPRPVPRPTPPPRRKSPNRLGQILQSLVAELSVLWLLLLGVFMVVVSSGVLAASQWEQFPAVIQYGILWFYTLVFWGSSFWSGGQPNLRLTTQALQIITLLLTPLNFLAIDSFGLWRSPLQWLVAVVAIASLTRLTIQVFRARSRPATHPPRIPIPLLTHLGLSYLHLGWSMHGFPLLATYTGVVGATFLSQYHSPLSAAPAPPSADQTAPHRAPFSLNGAVLIYAIAILLLRALFIAHIPITQLGLAIGLCGWLLIQHAPPAETQTSIQAIPRKVWEQGGGGLLLLGWLLSVATIPWQALIVSALILLVFAQRVLRTWTRIDLGALLFIGLQMVWLAWRMAPMAGRQAVVDWATRLTGTETMPVALLGVALFPYLLVILAVFDGLMQLRQRELAKFTGGLAWAFGGALVWLSLGFPVLRTVSLGLSTLALGGVTGRQQRRNLAPDRQRRLSAETVRSLAIFTHLGGLLTLVCAIDWGRPTLGLVPWAGIGLGLMAIEWWLSLGQPLPPDPESPPTTLSGLLRQSSWQFGLALGWLSYTGLLVNLTAQAHLDSLWGHPLGRPIWGGLWLIASLMLTGLIARVRSRRQMASGLSVGALGLAQVLTLGVPPLRSLSLGVSTGLMLVNTRYLQEPLAASITVGFGLGFIGVLADQLLPALPLAAWAVLGAIAALSLWLLRHGLTQSDSRLAALYQQASDGWAIALCSADLLLLLSSVLVVNPGLESHPISSLLTASLLMAAAAYRSWQTRQPLALQLSVAVILIAQIPFLLHPEIRWISFAIATLLMVIQTRLLQHWAAAAITVGLGLSCAGSLVWLRLPPPLQASQLHWLMIVAIAALTLWLMRHGLTRSDSRLAALFQPASDGWAIALCSVDLLLLLSSVPVVNPGLESHPIPSLLTASLLMTAAAYRSWQTCQRLALQLSVAVILITQIPFLFQPEIRWISFAVATLLIVIQTHLLRHWVAAAITIGIGLGCVGSVVWLRLPPPLQTSPPHWLLIAAIAAVSLWIWRHGLIRRTTPLAPLYAKAADGWAIGLWGFDLCALFIDLAQAPSMETSWRLQSPILVTVTLLVLMLSSAYRSWQPIRSAQTLGWGVAALLATQAPMIAIPGARLLLLGVAMILMLAHTHYLEKQGPAVITVGYGVGMLSLCLWDGVGAWRVASVGGWLLAIAIAVMSLWLLRSGLLRRSTQLGSTQLAALYSQAIDGWAIGLASLALIGLTLDSLLVYWQVSPASPTAVGAAAITLGAVTYRTWKRPTNWTLYALGWSLELLTLEVWGFIGGSIIALAIANTALGLLTQLLADWWHRRTDRPQMLSCWHVMPLMYGALGTALRWNLLAHWTGLSTLGLVLIVIGVGRRQAMFKPLLYLAVTGISVSAYELLFFQVRSLTLGDQLLAMAALAATIVYAYRILTPWLTDYLRLPSTELTVISHLHWGLGSLLLVGALLVGALLYPVEVNKWVGLGAGVFLTRYAIMQGRNQSKLATGEVWVYSGILEATGMALYATFTTPVLSRLALLLKPWAGAIAALIATAVYLAPWRRWGWSPRPWRLAAILAPLATVGVNMAKGYMTATRSTPNLGSLLVMAGFYGLLSWQRRRLRWLYVSLLLLDWAVWLLIPADNSTFARTCLIGLSILSLTWFEPACRSENGRSLRHNLRCLGMGLISVAALALYSQPGVIPGIIGIIGIFLGLGLRIRAFLTVGVVTFLAIAFYQMVILIFTYPLSKWIIGLLVGIVFIWIAAGFETRRQQFTTLLRNGLLEFEEWD